MPNINVIRRVIAAKKPLANDLFSAFGDDIIAYHPAGTEAFNGETLSSTYDTPTFSYSDDYDIQPPTYFMDYRNNLTDLTLRKAYDFSSGTDGVGQGNNVISGGNTIDGEDGWLKVVPSVASNFKQITLSGGNASQFVYLEFEAFLPTDNIGAMTFEVRDNANGQRKLYRLAQCTEGVRHKIRMYQRWGGDSNLLIRFNNGNGTSSWANTNAMECYLKNMTVYWVNNVELLGTVTASIYPSLGGGASNVYYFTDGIAEYFDLDTLATKLNGLTSFTMFGRMYDIEGTGVVNRLFMLGDGTTVNYMVASLDAANKVQIFSQYNTVTNTTAITTGTVTRGGWANYILSIDNGTLTIYIDGVSQTMSTDTVYTSDLFTVAPTQFRMCVNELTTVFDRIRTRGFGVMGRAVANQKEADIINDKLNVLGGV